MGSAGRRRGRRPRRRRRDRDRRRRLRRAHRTGSSSPSATGRATTARPASATTSAASSACSAAAAATSIMPAPGQHARPAGVRQVGGQRHAARRGRAPTCFDGGSGPLDTLIAGLGADTILATDGERDTIDCGARRRLCPRPTSLEKTPSRGCESSSVGKLALARLGLENVHLSWTHPKAWQQAAHGHGSRARRRARDRHRHDRPEALAAGRRRRRRARPLRLSRDGKTVSARGLKLKVDAAFAHRKLAYAVEAVDVDGRRQVER